jgi:hypothetical protein
MFSISVILHRNLSLFPIPEIPEGLLLLLMAIFDDVSSPDPIDTPA